MEEYMNTKAFRKISYGLFIVASIKDNNFNGQIANTVFQICSRPAILAISINKENLTHEYISESGIFSVSILAQDTPLSLIGQFGFKSGRKEDKFQKVKYSLTNQGLPYITDYALAYFEARVIQQVDVATHTIFIGEVKEADTLADGEPMTYAYYHKIKKGSVPPKAPISFPAEEERRQEEEIKGGKYECSVCGYIYDPAVGDPENDILPGTPFADLPESWVCPVCGVGKDHFSLL